MISQATFLFRPINVNQVNLNHTTLLNLALRIFEFLVQILLNVNLSNSPDILALFETHLSDSIANFVKEGLPFARDLSLENFADYYLCFGLSLLYSVCYFFFMCRPSSSLCTVLILFLHGFSFSIDCRSSDSCTR